MNNKETSPMTPKEIPTYTGHRARLQARVSQAGADSFLDHEFLELLLTYAIVRKDTKPIAWELLHRFGTIADVLDAKETTLMQTDGVGPYTARLLKLVRSAFRRYMRAKIPKKINLSSPQKVLDYCTASLAGKENEFLEVIFLSAKNNIIETRVLCAGSAAQVEINPRQILRHAINVDAHGVVLVHNHPSGDSSPSQPDITCTQKLAEGLQLFGIDLLDHIIITKGEYFSFREDHYLPGIETKTKTV